jgi:peptidoglycan/xylan/chitin deacetylase (PgdA/CDA1 family)/SAM-dependent methyltransferase
MAMSRSGVQMSRVATSFFLALASKLKGGGVIINGHTLTRSQTRLQLETLGRWFDFIGLEELPVRLNRAPGRPFCLLTFDDGKRNNFTEIAPELERARVPAVFYVTTEPLSSGACLWFDQRSQLITHLGHCPAGLELQTLKELPFSLLIERLDRACAYYDFTPDLGSDNARPMSWEEARDLAGRGFTIGAHGLTHAILTRETKERAFAEIEGSLSKVGSELGRPCTTFAFPNGNHTPELAQHALRCGATTVMTTDPLWVADQSPFCRLPRIQLFGEFTRTRIELKIALAALRGVLANPDGSGRSCCARVRRQVRRGRTTVAPEQESGTSTQTMSKGVQKMLRCPICRSSLTPQCGHFCCDRQLCGTRFPIVDGIPVLINDDNSLFQRDHFVAKRNTTFDLSRGSFIRRADHWLPSLSRNIPAKRNYRALADLLLTQSSNPVVLVIGGSIVGRGMESLTTDPRIQLVETDVSFGPRTQLICDAHELPFENHSFDGVVVQAVLQYLVDPSTCLREIERVLKPGGLVYAESAFMQQVVHGRYDFTRFTHLGLRRLFRGFEEVASGPATGPAMALAWSFQFFLLSLATARWTRRACYAFARLTLFWLKYLDAGLLNKPGTYDAASGFFFMGRKSEQPLSDRELVALYRGAQ